MKTVLIIILLIALSAAAFFTRPSQADFTAYVKGQLPDKPRNFWDKIFDKKQESERFLDGCTFKDRFVFVQVEKDGRVIYTGVFDHWFAHGTPIPKADRNDEKKQDRSDDHRSVVSAD